MHTRFSLKPCFSLFAAAFLFIASVSAQPTVMVGGAAMISTKNIMENAANSKNHTTLVAAVKTAGLEQTLQSSGPFTVFAPTNEAFNKLPAGTVETLLKPENKAILTAILTYHVVPGKFNSATLTDLIKKNAGKYTVKTVQNEAITFTLKDKNIILHDEKGGMSKITIKDVYQSNGIIQVIDAVLMPKG